jgi:chromosome segregation ATPase
LYRYGTGAVRGGNVPSRGAPTAGGRAAYNPGTKHALMPDVPGAGAGISSDQLGGGGNGGGSFREDGASRSELRNLRSIIADLEPKLREATKEAQMAGRRERTAVTQLANAKVAMDKKHNKAVDELAAAVAAAEERALDAGDECRHLHEELHKSEHAESKLRVELASLNEQFLALMSGKERYEKLMGEHEGLMNQLGVMQEEALQAAREMERLRAVARMAEQAREEAKVDAEEANRLLTTQMEQLHQAEKGVELLSQTNRQGWHFSPRYFTVR